MAHRRTRRFLVTGLAALLPTWLTIYLFYVAVITIHKHVGSKFNELFGIRPDGWRIFLGDAIAFLVFISLAWLAGFLIATYFGKVLFRRLDRAFRRIPLIRVVYPAVKQVSDFFLEKRAIAFSRVVAVEYPRRGIYSVGFLTGDGLARLEADSHRLMTVFIPNTPAPLTGFTIFVRQDEIISLELSVDEAIKLIVSGGVVVPDHERLDPARALSAGEKQPDTNEKN